MNNEKKIEVLDIGMMCSILFIGAIVVSLILSYNERLKLTNQKPFLNKNDASIIILLNRIVILVITIVILGASYEEYEYNKNNPKGHEGLILYLLNYLPIIQAIVLVILAFNDLGTFDESELINIVL